MCYPFPWGCHLTVATRWFEVSALYFLIISIGCLAKCKCSRACLYLFAYKTLTFKAALSAGKLSVLSLCKHLSLRPISPWHTHTHTEWEREREGERNSKKQSFAQVTVPVDTVSCLLSPDRHVCCLCNQLDSLVSQGSLWGGIRRAGCHHTFSWDPVTATAFHCPLGIRMQHRLLGWHTYLQMHYKANPKPNVFMLKYRIGFF